MKHIENVGFVLPIINGKIYVARRIKNPHKNFFGGIGGKAENYQTSSLLKKIFFNSTISAQEEYGKLINKEPPQKTALREMCEEMYTHLNYPQDFSLEKDFPFGLESFGKFIDTIDNNQTKVTITFYITYSTIELLDYYKKDEIEKPVPLENISASKIWSQTQNALFELSFALRYLEFYFQGGKVPQWLTTCSTQIPKNLKVTPVKKGEIRLGIQFYYLLQHQGKTILNSENTLREFLKSTTHQGHKLFDYYKKNEPEKYNVLIEKIREDYKAL